MAFEKDLNLEATELRLGLPGTSPSNKRASHPTSDCREIPPTSKAQVVGWPPVRSYRKNSFETAKKKEKEKEVGGMLVKVSMDGVPFLRKVDLKLYDGYPELLRALDSMFKFSIGNYGEREGYNGSEFVPTYEDKDGDWMLVGDVPWEMFIMSCKKLRIMKGSEARGLSCGEML